MITNLTNSWFMPLGLVAALGLSAWSLTSQKKLNEKLDAELVRLGAMPDLDGKVASLGRRLGAMESRLQGQAASAVPPVAAGGVQEDAPGGGAAAGNLETIARMDPGLLDSLQRKYSHEQAVRNQIEKLQTMRRNQQKADFERYGPVIQDLSRRISAGGADAEAAYGELLSKYPDSNAAVSAIGELGLAAAMDMKTSEVETYFTKLMSTPGGDEVVTEQGFQAASAMHSYLARTYIADGKFDEAGKIIDSLAQKYSDQMVPERGSGSEPQWITGQELANQLRTAVTNAASGLPAVPGTGNPPPAPGN